MKISLNYSNLIHKRSALHFAVFLVFSIVATVYVIKKANEAVSEIYRLQEMKIEARKTIEEQDFSD